VKLTFPEKPRPCVASIYHFKLHLPHTDSILRRAVNPPARSLGTAVADFHFARDDTSSSKLPWFFTTDGSEVTMAGLVVFRSGVKDTWLDGDEITRIFRWRRLTRSVSDRRPQTARSASCSCLIQPTVLCNELALSRRHFRNLSPTKVCT
jgi:hypothetical protein